MEYSVKNIDCEKLRKSIEDYYMAAYYAGMYLVVSEVAKVQCMSDEGLIEYAISIGFDLSGYVVKKK